MNRSCDRLKMFLFCMCSLFCLTLRLHAAETTAGVALRLETAGFNNVLITGQLSGNFTFADIVESLLLTFIDPQTGQQFSFSGDGGFVSLANQPKKLKRNTLQQFRNQATSYLTRYESLGFPDGASLIGSFAGNHKLRGVCSSLGTISPSSDIPLGEYQLTLEGFQLNGNLILSVSGTTTVSKIRVN